MRRLCDGTAEGLVAAEVRQSAAYRFRCAEDDISLEDFLEHLSEVRLLSWLARSSSLPGLLPDLTSNMTIVDAAAEKLRRTQRRVYQLIHDTCGDCSGTKVGALWRPILDAVSSQQPLVPVFTLNYDWSFEKLAIEEMNRYHLVDGFEPLGGKWDAGRFLNAEPAPHKTTIALFKLHGSTSWLADGQVKSMGRFPEDLTQDDDPPRQIEMVHPGLARGVWVSDESWGLNDPGEMFEPWTKREPYSTLYAHFRETARRAELLVVIGYAFHDNRVNSEVVEAVNANERTTVLVVDPGTTRQNAPFGWLDGLSECDWSRFEWLQGSFEDEGITTALIDRIKSVDCDPTSDRCHPCR